MTRSMYASVLPTIKCSDCGADIAISMMGDHICTGDLEEETPNATTSYQDLIAMPSFPPPFASPVMLPEEPHSAVPKVSVDDRSSSSWSTSPPEPASLSRPDAADGARSSSPDPREPSSMTQESISPMIQAPQQSETDPILTVVRPPSEDFRLSQGSAFQIFPSKPGLSRPGAPQSLGTDPRRGPTETVSPPSSSLNGGQHVLKRMHTISPGPFGARSRRTGSKASQSSIASRQPSISPRPGAAALRSDGPPPRPPRPQTDDSLLEQLQSISPSSLPMIPHMAVPPLPPPNSPQRAFEPINQSSAVNSTSQMQLSLMDAESASEPETLRPLPDVSPLHSTTNRQTGHASTSSDSSTGSRSAFGSRTESSRSSHSSPISPYESADFHQKDNSIDHTRQASDFNKVSPAQVQYLSPFFKDSVIVSSPLAQTAFAGHDRMPSMSATQSSAFTSLDPLEVQAQAGQVVPPRKQSLPGPQIPRGPKAKGACRECEKPIFGKSVKAADGRLTGRYHRECFVCCTCRRNFETAEFYIHNNKPYCAHDYHVVNNSLCHLCKRGIEGKYLEAQPSQKYHLDCLTCHACRSPLTSEYYELNHHIFCQKDAFGVYEKSRLLSPGKRFPERRTTRLMFMGTA